MTYKGWEDYKGPAAPYTSKRRKYNNTPTEIDSVTFASKREADRYLVLRDMVKAGEIRALQLQPKFPLHVVRFDGVQVEVGCYVADFQYVRADGTVATEDAKGLRTPLYILKKKMVENEYGVTILET